MAKGLAYSLSNVDVEKIANAIPKASITDAGKVKQATAISDLASDADTATTAAKVNDLLAALRASGQLAAS